MCLFVCAVDHGVNEGEPNEEYTEQYLRAGAREQVLRAGTPGRFRRWQVQSHPLMHILSQFYRHNVLAYFIKLHILVLLKPGWIATP